VRSKVKAPGGGSHPVSTLTSYRCSAFARGSAPLVERLSGGVGVDLSSGSDVCRFALPRSVRILLGPVSLVLRGCVAKGQDALVDESVSDAWKRS
jgi:hypothetical protein